MKILSNFLPFSSQKVRTILQLLRWQNRQIPATRNNGNNHEEKNVKIETFEMKTDVMIQLISKYKNEEITYFIFT